MRLFKKRPKKRINAVHPETGKRQVATLYLDSHEVKFATGKKRTYSLSTLKGDYIEVWTY